MTSPLTTEQVAALNAAGLPITHPPSPPQQKVVEPGYTTTEFWVTILTYVGALFASLFHKHLPVDATQFSYGAAGLASVGYAVSRAITKS